MKSGRLFARGWQHIGDHAWQDLLRKHNVLIREQLRAHDGYEVKTMGDGFMVAFQSAKKALACAIAIHSETSLIKAAEPFMLSARSQSFRHSSNRPLTKL